MSRESVLAQTLFELADTLVDDFDIVDLLTTLAGRCVDVLHTTAAGIMLVAPDGDLRLVTSSSESMRIVELFELQTQEGPCLDCYHTGQPVASSDLAGPDVRWPSFTAVALDAGFRAVDAIPMRLRRNIIGALNLFHTEPATMSAEDLTAAQSLADVATIAILQHNAATSAHTINEQLNQALNSRIVIEQAQRLVAEQQRISLEQAFTMLRNHARNHNERLADIAGRITTGTLSPTALDPPRV